MNKLPEGAVALSETVPVNPSAMSQEVGNSQVSYQAPKPIVIDLVDGRKIGMALPKMSLSMFINTVLADCKLKPDLYELERNRVKSLLYITDIDGVAEPKIADPTMRAALEQKIGDQFLDDIFVRWVENFGSMGVALSSVKKS